MILLDISCFFLESLNPVSVSELIAAVFLAERAAASGDLGCSTSSGGGCHQLQSGGVQLWKLLLQLFREVSGRRRALGEGRQKLGRTTNITVQVLGGCILPREVPNLRHFQPML